MTDKLKCKRLCMNHKNEILKLVLDNFFMNIHLDIKFRDYAFLTSCQATKTDGTTLNCKNQSRYTVFFRAEM